MLSSDWCSTTFLIHSLTSFLQQFDKYFNSNSVEKGGSFYVQSKIYRAKELLDDYVKEKKMEDKEEREQPKEDVK